MSTFRLTSGPGLTGLLFALLLVFGGAPGTAPVAAAPPGQREILVLAPEKPVVHPEKDEALALWIGERFAKIPTGLGLRKLTGAEREKVYELVDNTQAGALFHVQRFTTSPHRAETICALTYLMVINQARYLKVRIGEIKELRRQRVRVQPARPAPVCSASPASPCARPWRWWVRF